MKHIWSIICEKSSIDFESNLLSLFNCVEEMKFVVDKTKMLPKGKLVIPVNFQIVSFWSIEDFNKENILDIKWEFSAPKEKVLNEFKNILKIKKGIKRFRNRTNVQGMPITESGRYYFRIWQKKNNKFELVSELPIDVDLSYKILDNKDLKKINS